MNPRFSLIIVLVVIEIAIIGGIVRSIRGDDSSPWYAQRGTGEAAADPRLVEDGPHQVFDAGSHPALTVDIGYADLTILTRNASQIDVTVSKSTMYGFMRSKAAITARKVGDTVRIAKASEEDWSVGDDRMVTVVVPPETQVTVASGGDIRANGLRAAASFVSVGSGSVTIDDYDGSTLHVESSNGRVSLHGVVAKNLDASSSNGRVTGTALRVRDGRVESSNGNVTLGFAPGADTQITAEASNGNVRLSGFPATASTKGLRKSNSDDSDDDDEDSEQTIRVGAGTGRLDVHSSNGNINLSQET